MVRNKVIARRRNPDERCRARGGENGLPEPEASADAPDVLWEAAFQQAMLAFLLDIVRAEVHPRTYQAFEIFTLGERSAAEAARLTGLSRNAVYQARKNVLRRLRQLGALYGSNGPPDEMVRSAMHARPAAMVERSLITRLERVKTPATEGVSPP